MHPIVRTSVRTSSVHWINGHYNLLTLDLIDFLMKLFKTTNVEVVQACREVFHCELRLPSVQLTERYKKFIG